jgi:hypothetical protein
MKIDVASQLTYLTENFDVLQRECKPLWHPLGFSSCLILNNVGKLNLRIHYWPESERRTKNPDWPIHTHTYHLSSLVLEGTIRDIQYTTTAGEDYSVYSVSYNDENSEIAKTDRKVSILHTNDISRSKGETYTVERGVFHQSQVDFGKSAITLVALSDFAKDAPLVLGKDMPEERFPYDRAPFDSETFWRAVHAGLSRHLSGAS